MFTIVFLICSYFSSFFGIARSDSTFRPYRSHIVGFTTAVFSSPPDARTSDFTNRATFFTNAIDIENGAEIRTLTYRCNVSTQGTIEIGVYAKGTDSEDPYQQVLPSLLVLDACNDTEPTAVSFSSHYGSNLILVKETYSTLRIGWFASEEYPTYTNVSGSEQTGEYCSDNQFTTLPSTLSVSCTLSSSIPVLAFSVEVRAYSRLASDDYFLGLEPGYQVLVILSWIFCGIPMLCCVICSFGFSVASMIASQSEKGSRDSWKDAAFSWWGNINSGGESRRFDCDFDFILKLALMFGAMLLCFPITFGCAVAIFFACLIPPYRCRCFDAFFCDGSCYSVCKIDCDRLEWFGKENGCLCKCLRVCKEKIEDKKRERQRQRRRVEEEKQKERELTRSNSFDLEEGGKMEALGGGGGGRGGGVQSVGVEEERKVTETEMESGKETVVEEAIHVEEAVSGGGESIGSYEQGGDEFPVFDPPPGELSDF